MIYYYIDFTLSELLYVKEYIASITGDDEKYILRRDFLPWKYDSEVEEVIYSLDTGVYEVSYSVHALDSGERIYRKRIWLVVIDDRIREYEYETMNAEYVLYTLFNLKLQEGMSPDQALSDLRSPRDEAETSLMVI